MTGEITSKVENETAALRASLRRQLALTNTSSATAHGTNIKSGFTRSQHARPSSAPAAIACLIVCRFAASNNSHTPPSAIQLAGASAFGVAPASANRGDN